MAIQASGRITFHQVSDGTTVSFSITSKYSTKQTRYKDGGAYYPDYAKTAQVFTPLLTVPGGGTASAIKSTPTWYLDGVQIASGQNGFTVGTTAPFALTLNKNLTTSGHVLSCTYSYAPDAVHQPTLVRAEMPLNLDEAAGAAIKASIENTSGGTHFNTTAGTAVSLSFEGRMIRGGAEDTTDVTYRWFITGVDGKYYEITAATAPSGSGLPSGNLFTLGTNRKTITVSSKAVLNVATLKLVVKDTDASSGTPNMEASETVGLVDDTDPMALRFTYLKGDGWNASASTAGWPVQIDVVQDGAAWPAAAYNGKTLSFYRNTATGDKETGWSPTFTGWTTSGGSVSRAFSNGSGTDANRTVTFQPAHMLTTQSETVFTVELAF